MFCNIFYQCWHNIISKHYSFSIEVVHTRLHNDSPLHCHYENSHKVLTWKGFIFYGTHSLNLLGSFVCIQRICCLILCWCCLHGRWAREFRITFGALVEAWWKSCMLLMCYISITKVKPNEKENEKIEHN